jgi:hypothetical protein
MSTMSTTTFARSSARSTPTATPAREAAQALVDGLQALAQTLLRPSEIHPVVHRAAQALQAALAEGVPLREVLDALVGLTAPATPEDPPAPPWAPLLGLSLSAFAETGAALAITFRALGHEAQVWWCGSATTGQAVARERRIESRRVWDLARLGQEARQAGLDESATVASLVAALGGEVRGWRLAA